MTNEELVHEIINLYANAGKSKFPSNNIVRTKKHTISSVVEDLIAYFLSLTTDSRVIIDKSFFLTIDGKRQSLRPDIAIKNGNKITHFFDVKMDLGWKRHEFPQYCIEKSRMIKQIRNQPVSYYEHNLQISENIKYDIILVSDKNITDKKLSENLDIIKKAELQGEVELYFLTSKIHPNPKEGADFAKENIVINNSEIDKLRNRIS